MSKLPYLVAEINAALEIYLSARTGHQYNRTTFILCDDCAELTNKLFLIRDNRVWSDVKGKGYKNFKDITSEVRAVFRAKRATDYPAVDALLTRIEGRRERRNKFFHSTDLLDLNFHARDCVEAFCDLLDLGKLYFQADWDAQIAIAGNMETCEAIVRIDRKTYGDPSVMPTFNKILGEWPRFTRTSKRTGCDVAQHPDDMHLRLAIRNGGKNLRDKLKKLL